MIKKSIKVYCDWCGEEISNPILEIMTKRMGYYKVDDKNGKYFFHGYDLTDTDSLNLHFCNAEQCLVKYLTKLKNKQPGLSAQAPGGYYS